MVVLVLYIPVLAFGFAKFNSIRCAKCVVNALYKIQRVKKNQAAYKSIFIQEREQGKKI